MGFDLDESGRNEEYEADASEGTGEEIAAPVVVPARTTDPVGEAAARLVASVMTPERVVEEPGSLTPLLETADTSYMDAVDKRLEIANFFRSLLVGNMFSNRCDSALIVEREVHAFIRSRLAVLIGLQGEAPVQKKQLTDAEVQAVKMLAELTPAQFSAVRMLADKLVASGIPVIQAPRPTPSAPERTPVVPTVVEHHGPLVMPTPAQATSEQPQLVRRGPGRPPGAKNKGPDLTKEVVVIDKETGEPLLDKDGNPRKVKVSRIQRPAGALPFPNEQQMSGILESQAAIRAGALEANPGISKALTAVRNTPTNE